MKSVARPDHGRAPAVARRPLRHDLPAQLRHAQGQGRAGAHPRRRRGAAVRRRRLRDARLARSGEGRRARPDGRRRGARDPRAERAGRGRRDRRTPTPAGIDLQLSINAQGRLQTEEEFGEIVVKTGANGEVTRLRDVARIELGAADYSLRSLLDNKAAVAIADLPGARLQRASSCPTTCAQDDGELQADFPDGIDYEHRLRPHAVRARLDRGGGPHAARSACCWWCWW